jgi:HEAT repeat protein
MTTKLAPVEQRLASLEEQGRTPGGAPVILAALEDAAPTVRDRAIRLAARYLEPSVLTELVADGRNATRRNAGLSALERQGPYAVPHLVALLKGGDTDVVMFALQSLSRIGDTKAGPAILPLLGHADPNVAQAAIEAAGRLRLRESVSTLCWLLQGDLWVQLAAIVALGEIGAPEAVVPLMKFVPDSVLAEAAVHALRRIAAPDSLEPLLRLFPRIRERGLRDQLLLTVAVVLDLHPDPAPVLARVRPDLEPASADVGAHLGPLLDTAPDEEDDEAQSLLRAAATLAAALGVDALQPRLLSRLATDPRAAWIEVVLRRFPEGLTPRLAELLDHPDAHLRCGALRAGSFEATDCVSLSRHLSDPDAHVRAAACVALGRLEVDAVAPLLLERLRAGEPVEQAAAAQALAHLSSDALTELGSCLEQGMSEPATVEALRILTRRQVPGLEARVLHLTEARSSAVRLAALRAAAQIPGTRIDVLLLRALADREPTIQREALELLVQRGGETTVSTLVALLGTADSLRFHVIRALGHCQAPQAAGRLRDLYPDCAPHEQAQIVRSLLRLGPPWLSEFLVQRLHDADLELRRAAAQGLSEVAVMELLPVLLGLARDADWNIRNEAARGLARLKTTEARDALLTLARDEETVVATTARASLEQWSGEIDRTAA